MDFEIHPRSRARSVVATGAISTIPLTMQSPRFTAANPDADLVPVRMCNELVYCERLFHLEHVQGVIVGSADTITGRAEHEQAANRGRRRRKSSGPELPPWPAVPRSVELVSEAWGVRGNIDFVEAEDDQVTVVEAKHGKLQSRGRSSGVARVFQRAHGRPIPHRSASTWQCCANMGWMLGKAGSIIEARGARSRSCGPPTSRASSTQSFAELEKSQH